jgi:coproporphyrinogen III oxidase-like Fe-S oxidoreductase
LLRHLGRRHDSKQGIAAVEAAIKAGFENVNIDLMCGFAEEGSDDLKSSIGCAADLAPTHISLYTFRPTDGTVLRRNLDKGRHGINVGHQVAVYERGRRWLRGLGYEEYGVGYFGSPALNVTSAFGLHHDVVGFGSGAISVLNQAYKGHTSGQIHTYIDNPLSYDFEAALVSRGVALSLLRAGLSIYQGIKATDWLERTGETLEQSFLRNDLKPLLAILRSVGGLIWDEEGIRLPPTRAPLTLIGLMNGAMLSDFSVASKIAVENKDLSASYP